MNDDKTPISELKQMVRQFVDRRNWNQYHNPKNLCMSISIESAELMEHFQWTDSEPAEFSSEKKAAIADEMSDVLAYLLSLSNELEIDLASAFKEKMDKNCHKYPEGEDKVFG